MYSLLQVHIIGEGNGVEMGTRAMPGYRAPFNKLYHAIQQ